MDKFSITDYGIFNNAISTTALTNSKVTECNASLNDSLTKLSNESVFMGPVAEECVNLINELDTSLNTIGENFKTIADFLTTASATYKNADSKANQAVQLKLNGVSQTAINSDYKNPGNLSGYRLDFVNEIKDGAIETYNKYGVLPSLTLAQAILETGWGRSRIGNNIFGIKAGSSWTGKRVNCLTGEQNADGTRYQTRADFRDYDSVNDSIIDHAELLTKDRYKPVLEATNYKDACIAVKQCGYATSQTYSENLISIVEQYGLDQWDPK